jgi:hypothetical protein
MLEGAGFEPSVPRESNGEKAKEPVSLVERKVPEMSSTAEGCRSLQAAFLATKSLRFNSLLQEYRMTDLIKALLARAPGI